MLEKLKVSMEVCMPLMAVFLLPLSIILLTA
jgi:hypothetical protein